MRRLVQRIWDEARPVVAGDEVDRYLRGRGLTLHRHPPVLRFHPSLGYFEKGADGKSRQIAAYPAMLALIQAPDGQAVTLHRTYLKDGRSSTPPTRRRCSPPASTAPPSACSMPARSSRVCEGIETAWRCTWPPASPCGPASAPATWRSSGCRTPCARSASMPTTTPVATSPASASPTRSRGG
jgi:hypothetical protein